MRLLESERAVISTEEFSYSCGIGKKEKRDFYIYCSFLLLSSRLSIDLTIF